LANKHFREALERTLTVYIAAGDINVPQAIDIAVDILFWNSNSLYKLDEERKFPELLRACGRESVDSMRTLVNGGSKAPSFRSYASTAVATPGLPIARTGASSSATTLPATIASSNPLVLRSASASAPSGQSSTAVFAQQLTIFDAFLQTNPGVKYIWLQF